MKWGTDNLQTRVEERFTSMAHQSAVASTGLKQIVCCSQCPRQPKDGNKTKSIIIFAKIHLEVYTVRSSLSRYPQTVDQKN